MFLIVVVVAPLQWMVEHAVNQMPAGERAERNAPSESPLRAVEEARKDAKSWAEAAKKAGSQRAPC